MLVILILIIWLSARWRHGTESNSTNTHNNTDINTNARNTNTNHVAFCQVATQYWNELDKKVLVFTKSLGTIQHSTRSPKP